ncbi:ATP synthase subunit O, mitochondrial-like [Bolinopsis microptera]|uniref:ATP synthase subunit O, mitochondrial-like n=1 Tax=Bolinopsis microptera TaxID=2820187 RepID=UPI00307AABC5
MAARLAAAVRCHSRSLSTASEFIRGPVQVFGIEGRYAHALYSAATKAGSADAIESQLNSLQGAIDSVSGVKEYLTLPVCSKEEKKSTLGGAFDEAGIDPLIGNMVSTMIDNKRSANISGVVGAFNTIMAAQRGEVPCKVTSAAPLSDEHLDSLKGALGSFLKPNEKLLLDTATDASLIGGMVVEIGDKRVDMSTASKIKKLKTALSLPL